MNEEEKLNLEKAIISQTWNERLAKAVVSAVEGEASKPKRKKETSALQRAVEMEQGKKSKPAQEYGESAED